jgi:hypothetical protein
MENKAVANELMGLEKKYWQAMESHDLATAISLTDFPCIVAGPQGAQLVDQEQFTKMFESHKGASMKVSFRSEPSVRLINDDIAVIAYQVHSDMNMGGKEQSLDAVDTSTWIRRNGKWACAHHTETPLTKQ